MGFNLLSKYFPLPHFVNPNRIGISFSDSGIKAIFVDGSSSNPRMKGITIPLDKGVISGGKILDGNILSQKIELIKSISNSKFVFFTISDELSYIFNLTIPIIQAKDIYENVAFSIEENVPLSLSETIFDFSPTDILSSTSGYTAEVVVAASAKKEIYKFVDVLKKVGFDPLGCLHESQAIANSVIPKGFNGTVSIVHSMQDRFGIYLVKKGIVYFSTTRSVSQDDYKDQFLDEYAKFTEYSFRYSVNNKNPIDHILVCGNFQISKGLIQSLSQFEKGVKNITFSNVWTNIIEIEKVTPSISYEESLNLAGAIGAVLSNPT